MYKTPNKKYVKISGTKILILIDDEYLDKQEADGIYKDDKIYLRKTYDDRKEYLRVYRHECFHALCEILGIQLDHHAEEMLAHRVSIMMTTEI